MAGFIEILSNLPLGKSTREAELPNSIPENSPGDKHSHKGKSLFVSNCASCHTLFKESVGPSLSGFKKRGPWADRKNIYAWINNPAAFMRTNEYTQALKEKYGSMMTAFPDLTREEIDIICEYVLNSAPLNPAPLAAK